ncbi:Spore germination protein B3 precursor [compost metagenome]
MSHKNWAATGKITLQQFIVELERGGSNPIMSGVELKGDPSDGGSVKNVQTIMPKSLIQHAGIAVFKNDRLVGWLGEDSSKTINYALNEVDSTVGNITLAEGGTAAFTVIQAVSGIDINLNSEGEPEFILKLKVKANLTAVQSTLDLSKPSSIDMIQNKIEDQFNTLMTGNIKEVQKQYGSDIFGFGEALHRKHPKLWKKYRSAWDDRFKTAKVSVRSNVAILQVGSIIQPQRREVEKK